MNPEDLTLSELCKYVVKKASDILEESFLKKLDEKLVKAGPTVVFHITDTGEIFAIKSIGGGRGKYTEDPDEIPDDALVVHVTSEVAWSIILGKITPDEARFTFNAIKLTNVNGGDELPYNKEVAWRICVTLFDFLKTQLESELEKEVSA